MNSKGNLLNNSLHIMFTCILWGCIGGWCLGCGSSVVTSATNCTLVVKCTSWRLFPSELIILSWHLGRNNLQFILRRYQCRNEGKLNKITFIVHIFYKQDINIEAKIGGNIFVCVGHFGIANLDFYEKWFVIWRRNVLNWLNLWMKM